MSNMTPFESRKDAALAYIERGWAPLPLSLGSKAPHQKRWTELRLGSADAQFHFTGSGNVGLLLGEPSKNLVVVDLDCEEAVKAARLLPPTGLVSGHGETPRTHYFYAVNTPVKTVSYADDEDMLVELRSTGSHVLVEPSVHPNGDTYRWDAFGEAALIDTEELQQSVRLLASACALSVVWPWRGSKRRQACAMATAGWLLRTGMDVLAVETLLAMTALAANDDDSKQRVSCVEHAADRLKRGKSVYGRTKLIELLGAEGAKVIELVEGWLGVRRDAAGRTTVSGGQIRALTDMGNAERLVDRHGQDLRYCRQTGWLTWDGSRWQRDSTGEVHRRAKATARGIGEEGKRGGDDDLVGAVIKWGKSSESRGALNSMIEVAQSDPSIAIAFDDLDADNWLLNLKNGTLDLRTGHLREHSRDDLLTKSSAVTFDPEARCDRFETFLDQVLGHDEEYIRWVQKMVGYCLTGETIEQCFFLMYGTGANGKTTFIEVLRELLGDYSMQADFSTFTASKNTNAGGAREDVARLRAARVVAAVEGDLGARLSEAMIKQITGSDTVTARELYKSSFEFRPQLKLILAANHKPEIKGTDDGIWRRVRFMRFTVTLAPEQRDGNLPAKLKEELSGILNWALEGLRLWREEGLGTCAAVEEATREYRQESNPLEDFLEAYCIRASGERVTVTEFHQKYAVFCVEQGDIPLSKSKVSATLAAMGIPSKRGTGGSRQYIGLGFRELSISMLRAVPD